MTEMNNDTLANLALQALERTAFVLADPVSDEEANDLPAADLYARITYTGPTNGNVVLAASKGFVCELAASLLGVEPEEIDVDDQGKDALCELANIVGGSVVLKLGGTENNFSLGLPSLITANEATASDADASCNLNSDEELLKIMWVPNAAVQTSAA